MGESLHFLCAKEDNVYLVIHVPDMTLKHKLMKAEGNIYMNSWLKKFFMNGFGYWMIEFYHAERAVK